MKEGKQTSKYARHWNLKYNTIYHNFESGKEKYLGVNKSNKSMCRTYMLKTTKWWWKKLKCKETERWKCPWLRRQHSKGIDYP